MTQIVCLIPMAFAVLAYLQFYYKFLVILGICEPLFVKAKKKIICNSSICNLCSCNDTLYFSSKKDVKQTFFLSFQSNKQGMASFSFHGNYPEPALIDQVKITKPSQTKSKHLSS